MGVRLLGVVKEAGVLCVSCAQEKYGEEWIEKLMRDSAREGNPIAPYWSGYPVDSPVWCDACGALIPQDLSSLGEEEVRTLVRGGHGTLEELESLRKEYAYLFDDQ